MSVRHRRLPPSRLSAATTGEAPAARHSLPGSAPNATHDVPCPMPPTGHTKPTRNTEALQPTTPSRSGPGPAAGFRPGSAPGLRPGSPSRSSVPGLAAGFRPGRHLAFGGGHPTGRARVRRRGSVSADAASGGDTQPVGPGAGGGTLSWPMPGLRRGRPAGWPGSAGGVPSRRTLGLRRGRPAGWSPGLRWGCPAGWFWVWWWGSVSRRCPVSGGTPNPSAPGPTAGFRLGGHGLRPPAGVSSLVVFSEGTRPRPIPSRTLRNPLR